MYEPSSHPSLISNTLIVNGTTKNPTCYNSFNNEETVMELLVKHEGELSNITLCAEKEPSAAIARLMKYFLLRSRLGIKYPVRNLVLETTSDEAWNTVGLPLQNAGYTVSLQKH